MFILSVDSSLEDKILCYMIALIEPKNVTTSFETVRDIQKFENVQMDSLKQFEPRCSL